MNLKNVIMGLVLLPACFCEVAPAAPIPATAILDTSPGFNGGAGAGLLTDGTIGDNNWLSAPMQYLGWTDSGYVPTDGGVDSGVAQPQLTFDLGGMYFVDSVAIHYMVDYPPGTLRANVRAPDSMTALFSSTGTNGSFGGNLVETGFDDSPDGDTSAGGGRARTLILNAGGVPANAVRLDFRTDGEWLMLSEITIQGRAVTNVAVKATAILDTRPNFNGGGAGLLTDGTIGGNNWLSAPMQYLGWTDPGYGGVDGGVDSGMAQPQLTFDLGGNYWVDSVTIHYMVDYPPGTLRANIRAPDSMTALLGLSGTNGSFGGNLVEAGFDDSPEGDANAGGGTARSLTMSLGGTPANAMRLDFRSDGEWLFVSEVTFRGTAVPAAHMVASLNGNSIWIRFDTVPGLWYRLVRADTLPATRWTEVSGWSPGLGLPVEVVVGTSTSAQRYFRVEISPRQPKG